MEITLTGKIPKSDREWRATTGFDKGRFLKLAEIFEKGYVSVYGRSFSERTADSPKESTLKSAQDLLFFTLFVLKSGLTFDVLGFVYGFDQSNCQRHYHSGLQVLESGLSTAGQMPKRSFESPAEFSSWFSGQKTLILDATEQRIQRPDDNEMQKACFSGKKKPHR